MIHREATIKYKGYDPDDLSLKSNKRICCVCDTCGRVRWISKNNYTSRCQKCANKKTTKSEEWKRKQLEGIRKCVKDPEWVRNQKEGVRKNADLPEWIKIVTEANRKKAKDPEWKKKQLEGIRKIVKDPEWQRKQKDGARKNAEDPEWQKNNKESAGKRSENSEWQKNHKEAMEKLHVDPKFQTAIKRRNEDSNYGKKISAGMQGIPLDEWNGFITNDEHRLYNSSEYKEWRTSVYKRDNYTCQMCSERGGKLNGHHIYKVSNYPELIFEINNGITLCYDCHFHKVNQHEKEYEIEFLSKIFDNKGIEIFGGEC